MTTHRILQMVSSLVEVAEVSFSLESRAAVNETKRAAVAERFNAVLEAAAGILVELGEPALADQFVEDWVPLTENETWSGSDPIIFERHLCKDAIHRFPCPDPSVLH